MTDKKDSAASTPIRVSRSAFLPVVYGREDVEQDAKRSMIGPDAGAPARADSYQPFRALGGHKDRGLMDTKGGGMMQDAVDCRRPERISYSLSASSYILLNRGEEEPPKEDWMREPERSFAEVPNHVGTLACSTVNRIGGKTPSREDWMQERQKNSAGERNAIARIAGSTIYPI
jgi:hypothetical protein